MIALLLSLALSASAFPGNVGTKLYAENQYRQWPCETGSACHELDSIENFTCDGGLLECEVVYNNILLGDKRAWTITGLGRASNVDSRGSLRTFAHVQFVIDGELCESEKLLAARQDTQSMNYPDFMATIMETVQSCTHITP